MNADRIGVTKPDLLSDPVIRIRLDTGEVTITVLSDRLRVVANSDGGYDAVLRFQGSNVFELIVGLPAYVL
jgi:hypothetical protein